MFKYSQTYQHASVDDTLNEYLRIYYNTVGDEVEQLYTGPTPIYIQVLFYKWKKVLKILTKI
jgi:hypothetical protein